MPACLLFFRLCGVLHADPPKCWWVLKPSLYAIPNESDQLLVRRQAYRLKSQQNFLSLNSKPPYHTFARAILHFLRFRFREPRPI